MVNSVRPPFALKRGLVRARQAVPSLPDESGVGFALKRFAVRARRAQTSLPEWSAALLIGFHLAVVPTASFGVKLLQPVLEQRAAQQVSVARNADVLETVWALVSGQHYGVDLDAWADGFEELEHDLERVLHSDDGLHAAVGGLMTRLQDPYSKYTPPLQQQTATAASTYGLELAERPPAAGGAGPFRPEPFVVSSLTPDSPAERAGLRLGDMVLEVDGLSTTKGFGADTVRRLLRAPVPPESGGTMQLRVQRGGGSRPRTVVVVAPPADAPADALARDAPVRGDVLRSESGAMRVGYLRIRSFSEAGTATLRSELKAMEAAGDVRGYLLDLRNNPGGQVREAMEQASLFLPNRQAVVAYTLDSAGFLTTHDVKKIQANEIADLEAGGSGGGGPPPAVASAAALTSSAVPVEWIGAADAGAAAAAAGSAATTKPIVVLVDRGTASSAELLAAALHDNERALLVGEATYGKGLIQRVFPLPDGGELKLTIGEYLRPTKQHVRRGVGGGIQPDLRCAATPWGGEGAAPDTCVRRAAEWIGAADALADAGAVADRGSLLQLSRPL